MPPKRRRKTSRKTPPVKKIKPPETAPSKEGHVGLFRFKNDDSDPVIENLKEVHEKQNQVRGIDHEVLDQVALEGLTGITFRRMCLILDAIVPTFNSCNDDAAQDHIWSVIVKRHLQRAQGAGIQIFHLDLTTKKSPNKRLCEGSEPESKKNFIIDKQIKLPNQSLKRMAKSDGMLHPVQDGDIMGSCPNYTSRVNISQEIVNSFDSLGPRQSLEFIHSKYDLKTIYFVADQEVRRRALLPMSCDPNMDLSLREYACLEMIGRSRCYGTVFPNDKTLGRYRILLTAKGLITQYQQTCNTFIVHHIRRFSVYNLESGLKAFKGGSKGLTPTGSLHKMKAYHTKEDGCDGNVSEDDLPTVKNSCCHPKRLKTELDILKMVYDVIARSNGRSMGDIRRRLKFPKSHVRNHLKNLANIELIVSHTRIIQDKKTRIYRARHKSNKRKTNKKSTLKGVKARWDDIDIRARELLGIRRSHFTQAEDSLLILCRIAGLLIEPSFKKSFIVSKQVIRDILHDELHESQDKTSDALLRRAKFLRRLPQNVTLMNELTAELRDDSSVIRLIELNKDVTRSEDKMTKTFKQLLRAIRGKLPHLLGITSSFIANSNENSVDVKNLEELKQNFEIVKCSLDNSNEGYHQPASTLIQLICHIDKSLSVEITKCEDMRTIMLLTSRCVDSSFNLLLKLKVPVRVVGLDQENENFREIFEQAKESKEASRLIANLTTPNPTADSRRALFMLRNALKLQTIDKCGKLADALVVQPCHIEFSSDEDVIFKGEGLIKAFFEESRFFNELLIEDKLSGQEAKRKQRRLLDRNRKFLASSSAKWETMERSGEQVNKPTTSAAEDRSNQSLNRKDEKQSIHESFKSMIESVMSWVNVNPGIELETLQAKLDPLLGKRDYGHLNELLELMESLELISRDCSLPQDEQYKKPRLFGYERLNQEEKEQQIIVTFSPKSDAYVKLCQILALKF